jgi:hypothetical protein
VERIDIMRKATIAVAAAVCLLAGFIAAGVVLAHGGPAAKAAAVRTLDKKVDDG